MISVSILFSGRGTNAESIIKSIYDKKLNFNIKKVICNNINAPGILNLKKYNIETIVINEKSFKDKNLYNLELEKILDANENEILLLCGYMSKIPQHIINSYKGNIINIHPSLLPKYKGLNTHSQVILNKDPYHGCSTHYVTSNIDCGPVIAQYIVPVVKGEDVEKLEKKILSFEHILFFKTLKMFEKEDIELVENKIFYKNSILSEPIKFN
jgi:phosphoribosylglycinamide formyltransferase-1